VAQFHVHHVQVTIHFLQVEPFLAHLHVHKVHKEVAHRVQECQDHVQVLYVRDSQHVHHHHVLLAAHQVHNFHHAPEQVHHHLVVHIVQVVRELEELAELEELQEHQVVHLVVHQVAVVQVAVAQLVHLERMQANLLSANQNQEKRCVMNSTICRHQSSVAQLFLTVMERLRSACVAVLRLQILQRRSMQIQQRWLQHSST
jgi:hypothetical protein